MQLQQRYTPVALGKTLTLAGTLACTLALTAVMSGGAAASTAAASTAAASTTGASTAGASTGAVSAAARRPTVPAQGALFGAAVSGRPRLDVRASVTGLESQLGRKFDIHRLYDVWDDAQPEGITSWSAAGGRTPVLSIKASRRNGTVVPWADIAAGREDAQIRAQARGLKAFNVPLFLSLHHEPENDLGHGTSASYIAAWRHYVSVFRGEGVTNVSFTWILMSSSFARFSTADVYYPGDDVIDWVAADGYNWFGAEPGKAWRPLADALGAFYTWGVRRGKPMMIAEYGALEDPAVPGRKAAWVTQSAAALKTMPGIKAVLYFHSPVIHPWWIDSSASSLAAFAGMGRDRYFTARSTPAPHAVADFDGNGSTDLAVYRPSTGGWYVRGGRAATWGRPTDLPVPADYNGDGRTEIAVWRPADGRWYLPGPASVRYGLRGDVPVPADYNGDGRAEYAVFRPATGSWWIRGLPPIRYGLRGDVPVPADYNGDGRADLAVFRPATGTWWIRGLATTVYGRAGDVPVPADYTNDGRTDLAVFRPTTATWYVRGGEVRQHGSPGDVPVPGDYNADGAADLTVYTPTTGTWSTVGTSPTAWGIPEDDSQPLPQAIRGAFGM